MSNLKIFYFSGTHWDREWYQSFQGFRSRLVKMMNDLVDALEGDNEFKVFHLDGQTIVLEDFEEIESGKRSRVEALIKDGRLIVGPWYVMPDEFLLSGESLIKNLIIGHKLSKEWGGEPWKYGYICDIFGHIAQMPQIFNGFDIKYSLLGRGTNEHTLPAHFIWKAPDGSECITFKLKDGMGYGDFFINNLDWYNNININSLDDMHPRIKNYIDKEIERSVVPVVVLMDALDHEVVHVNTPEIINKIKEVYPQADVYHANLINMAMAVNEYKENLPIKVGEINEPAKVRAGYIHLITHTLSSRYPIKKSNDICQTLLEKWVQPLTAIAQLKGYKIQKSYVDLAYKYLIQNHPHDSICGCSIDQVHKDMEYRFDQTQMIGNQVIDDIMNYEKSRYEVKSESHNRVLLLWNPLPFSRKEVINVNINFNSDYPEKYQEPFGYELKNSFKIFDHQENEIPYNLVSIKKGSITRSYNQFVEYPDIHNISLGVEMPPMGKVEYKIVPYKASSRYLDVLSKDFYCVENNYIKLVINRDGSVNIIDKATGSSYNNLINYLDDGEIGDGWYHANPVEDRLIDSRSCECVIERVENGPVRTIFKITHFMKVPEEMDYYKNDIKRSSRYVDMKVTSYIGLSKDAKMVDVETIVNNTAKDHRLRLHLPTQIASNTYFVNQPFAFIERKTGINIETQDWKECEVPEKQMEGIVGKKTNDSNGLAFISQYGLHECAALDDSDGSLLITLFRSFGKTVMTNGEIGGQIIGEHKFKYAIAPIHKNTSYADLKRIQDTMQSGVKTLNFRVDENYSLAAPESYIEIVSENVCMSVLKRPENNPELDIVIRLYNLSDENSSAEIKCFMNIAEITEINLNEEYICGLNLETNTRSYGIIMSPWKIKTYGVKLENWGLL